MCMVRIVFIVRLGLDLGLRLRIGSIGILILIKLCLNVWLVVSWFWL